jgi:hypothetical protein
MDIPHIRHVERQEVDEDPPVIAMRNIRYVQSEHEQHVSNRTIKRVLFWAAMLYLLVAAVTMRYGEDLMSPRAEHIAHQVAAGIFLLMVIANFVADIVYRGGDPNK